MNIYKCEACGKIQGYSRPQTLCNCGGYLRSKWIEEQTDLFDIVGRGVPSGELRFDVIVRMTGVKVAVGYKNSQAALMAAEMAG